MNEQVYDHQSTKTTEDTQKCIKHNIMIPRLQYISGGYYEHNKDGTNIKCFATKKEYDKISLNLSGTTIIIVLSY